MAVSADGLRAVTTGADQAIKLYDIQSFDMVAMIMVDFVPSCAAWAYPRGTGMIMPLLIVGSATDSKLRVYNADTPGDKPTIVQLHSTPVTALAYNEHMHAVTSGEMSGVLEMWSASEPFLPLSSPQVDFTFKMDTALFDLAKQKATPTSLSVALDGSKFVATSTDSVVRVISCRTGKLLRAYDDGEGGYADAQREKKLGMDAAEYGKRKALTADLRAALAGSFASWELLQPQPVGTPPRAAEYWSNRDVPVVTAPSNAVFDETGNFVLYPSMLGVKVVNLASNSVEIVLGRHEATERFCGIALYQGIPHVTSQHLRLKSGTVAGGSAALKDTPDPTLFACGLGRPRFFVLSRREPDDNGDDGIMAAAASGDTAIIPVAKHAGERDVLNEKPEGAAGAAAKAARATADLAVRAVIHTTLGDITVRLLDKDVPRTVENFTGLSKRGYYDGVVFHRVIPKFMVQTGDPKGDGTGGESIWGGEFEDEIRPHLQHDRPFTVSMANAGPGTNGSQFFITTVACPFLDGKHTVFGRVVKGMDTVQAIEETKTDKRDRPLTEIKIVNVDVMYT